MATGTIARGSVQLRHKKGKKGEKGCEAKGKDARACKCGPTVYAVLMGDWTRIGYLAVGWRKGDLDRFDGKLAEMREALEEGAPYKPRRPKRLSEWGEEWFAELEVAAREGHISRLTYNTYEGNWHNHIEPALGAKPIAALDAASIRAYVSAKLAEGMKPRTANATLTPLSAMLTDAVEEGLVQSNPARQPRKARHGGSRRHSLYAQVEKEKPKHLEPQEALALLAASPEEHRPMVLAALSAGLRRGELLGLRWQDIKWADRRIEICGQLQERKFVPAKCGSERSVVLYSGLARELGKRRQAEGYVFLDPDGKPWGNSAPAHEFLAAAYENAGLRRRGMMWHALRHTYASILAAGDIRQDVVSILIGHKRRSTTSLYTHLFADAFEGVEEALDAVLGVNPASMKCSVTTEHNGTVLAA